MITCDIESPPVSQYGKLPSSHISSALRRGDAALKGWATENVAAEGAPFRPDPLSATSGSRFTPICPALLGTRELLPQMQEIMTQPGCCSVGLSPWCDQIAHFDSQFGFIFSQSLSLRAHLSNRESLTAYLLPCLLLGGTNPA